MYVQESALWRLNDADERLVLGLLAASPVSAHAHEGDAGKRRSRRDNRPDGFVIHRARARRNLSRWRRPVADERRGRAVGGVTFGPVNQRRDAQLE